MERRVQRLAPCVPRAMNGNLSQRPSSSHSNSWSHYQSAKQRVAPSLYLRQSQEQRLGWAAQGYRYSHLQHSRKVGFSSHYLMFPGSRYCFLEMYWQMHSNPKHLGLQEQTWAANVDFELDWHH